MTVLERKVVVAKFGVTRRSLSICLGGVVIVALLAVMAWSQRPHGSPSVSASGRPAVVGVVRIEGGPAVVNGSGGSDVRPLRNATVIVSGTTAGGAALHRQFRADAQGRFSVNLPAGHYTVTAIAFSNLLPSLSRQPHAKVNVTPGRPVKIRLTGHVQ